MIPEHERFAAMMADLRAQRLPHRPPIRPWRFLEVGQGAIMPTMAAAKAGVAWAKRHGRLFVREKQKDGTGWMVRRKA
jgi:hypothetical protein